MSIEVRPWPTYSDDGHGPYWEVRLSAIGFTGWVSWGTHQQRFTRSAELSRLTRSNPRLLFAAERFMREFAQLLSGTAT